jgi:Domain of unknown function (DUF5666)
MQTLRRNSSNTTCRLLLAVAITAGLNAAATNRASQNQAEPAAKPTEHVLGTITSVDSATHTVTVKDDKSGTEYVVSTANTRTLIKVLPGAKDLKGATRITAEDLATGDRVDIRGFKVEEKPNAIAAKSVVLMSARELEAKHNSEAAAWQNSTVGVATAVDPSARTVAITTRTPQGPKSMIVQVPPSAELTRYSPDNPKTPVASQITDIAPGDQVRVIGSQSPDGTSLAAERVYSGAFRTVAGTITAISPDGKGLTLRNLQTKQPVGVAITESSAIHRLPPEMASIAANRMSAGGARPPEGQQPPPATGAPPDGLQTRPRARGDLSQMIQRLPEASIHDLKPGDAVIVSGALASDKSQLIATNIIAGVEPLFQSGQARQSQSLGDWSLDLAVPNQ